MDRSDIISLLIAAYKDKVERTLFDKLRAGMNELLSADADSRREQTAADIIQMARLKTALRKFEISYTQIQEQYGRIDAIDEYVAEIQSKIKAISNTKNHK